MTLNDTLDKVGIEVLSDFAPSKLIEHALEELTNYFNHAGGITVDNDDIKIHTLNGENLLIHSPASKYLYDYSFNYLSSHLPNLIELDDKTIGMSANYMNKDDDRFRLHFDRNEITLVIYLNDNNAFPLTIYPNVRDDPRSVGHKQTFELQSKIPTVITPKQNVATIFYGRRSFHGIHPAKCLATTARYSLQFAFDLSKQSYKGECYYGHS